MLHIATYQGQNALAGLMWSRPKPKHFWQSQIPMVSWGDRSAYIDIKGVIGVPSLMSLLMGSLVDDDTRGAVLCAYGDEEKGIYFAGLATNGKPALEKEHVFESEKDFTDYLKAECESGHIDRLATTAKIADGFHTHIPVVFFDELTDGFEPAVVVGEDKKDLPPAMLALLGFSTLGIVAIGWLGYSYFTAKTAVPVIEEAVFVAVDSDAFSKSCLEAFKSEWPQSPGWTLMGQGCATHYMNDPELASLEVNTPIAYRAYTLRGGHNDILARRTAEQVYDGSGVNLRVKGKTLFATAPINAPVNIVENVPARNMSDILLEVEDVFLGIANTIVLISDRGQSRVRVETNHELATIFTRLALIKDVELASIYTKSKQTTFEIIPTKLINSRLHRKEFE